MIKVDSINKDSFIVTINKDSVTEHDVLLSDSFHQIITKGKIDKVELITKSFEFLLKRESNQSILKQFRLEVIQHYFPEYTDEMKKSIL